MSESGGGRDTGPAGGESTPPSAPRSSARSSQPERGAAVGLAEPQEPTSTETIEHEGDRLFKTPEKMERAEKIAVLESIAKGFEVLKMSAQMKTVLWAKHVGNNGYMDPDQASLDALNALLGELRALHRAAESRKR
jgi:hypothetical protein